MKENGCRLVALRDGVYADDLVIVAATRLDIFTLLSERRHEFAEIREKLDVAERPLDVTLTLLASMGLLSIKDGKFGLTPVSREYLVAGSLYDLRPFYASQAERPTCNDLFEVLKTGKPALWSSRREGGVWETLMEEDGFSSGFTAAMDSRGSVLAPPMAERLDCEGRSRLLDIAGGSGVYACSVVEKHPRLRATVLEKPPVDGVARDSIERRGMSDRVDVTASDMFSDPLPTGFEIHLWSHVLHDWDLPEVESLLSKSFDSLGPGGMVAIHDAHLNENKDGPLEVARFSVLLMHSTEGRCYSVGELGSILAGLGFDDIRHVPTVFNRSLITAARPS